MIQILKWKFMIYQMIDPFDRIVEIQNAINKLHKRLF